MKHLSLLLAGCALLAACSSPKTHFTCDRGAAFSGIKSYALVPDKTIQAAEGVSNEGLWHDEITKAIDAELAAKNIQATSLTKRDVFVAVHVFRKNQGQTTLLNNYSSYKLSKKAEAQADLSKIIGAAPTSDDTVTLVIDVINPVKKEIIWRGWAQTEFKPNRTAQQRKSGIKKLVHEILADFPPKQ